MKAYPKIAKTWRSVFLLTNLTLFVIQSSAQNFSDSQHKNGFLSGYARTISGERIDYHSFHPYANSALLTRNTSGNMRTEWETDTLPEGYPGMVAEFIWIGGFSTGTSDSIRYYELQVNDRPVLTFETHPGCDTSNWSISGTDGIRLSYRHVWVDHVNDAFGYFILQVPVVKELKGRPLKLAVTGQKQNDGDWYMTFRYHFGQSADIRPVQAIMNQMGQKMQSLRVAIDYPSIKGKARIRAGNLKPFELPLQLGINLSDIPVPLVQKDTLYPVEISVDGKPGLVQKVHLEPVQKRSIYLIHHSHNDIGYTDLQPNILKLQEKNIRTAMRLIRESRNYPVEARFRWNVEIMWAVDHFLKNCSPAEKEEFIQDVREGSMGLQGLYTNVLTGIARPEELMRITDIARSFTAQTGIPVRSAMVSDIPGFSWNLVPSLAQAGIRYFSSGPNGSDRIGHSTEAWGDRPFWWVSPSGNEKVLFWLAGKGYSLFHYTTHISTNPEFSQKLFNYLDELKTKGYPYDMVQIRYTVYSDNGPTDSTLCEFVKNWNEKYESPKLIISTTDAMFEDFEKKWGDQIPSSAGDFTPYWEDGALSSAQELASTRHSSDRLTQAEVLSAITGNHLSDSLLLEAWSNVHLFDEHTWGAWNSISDPANPGVLKQWEIKKGFADQAEKLSGELFESALGNGKDPYQVEVINTLSWARNDVVRWSPPTSSTGWIVMDSKGKQVPSQLLSTGELAILALNVPPLGSVTYSIQPQKKQVKYSWPSDSLRLQNEYFSIQIDPQNGSLLSVKEPDSGREFVGRAGNDGLNAWRYVTGKNPPFTIGDSKCVISYLEKGPLVRSIRISTKVPGSNGFNRDITVCDGINRIDITNSLDKLAVNDKEAFYSAFPIALVNSVIRFDLGWGTLIPDINQLPGACRDFFSVQRWADISNQETGLTITINETPLAETGKISDELPHNSGASGWLEQADHTPVIWSYVLNNYWHTNYKASQEGMINWHYSLVPHGQFIAQKANQSGLEQSFPLLVRNGTSNHNELKSLFILSSENIITSSIHRSSDGKAWMIRLYNISASPGNYSIQWKRFAPSKVYRSSLLEEKGEEVDKLFFIPANGILTLRCEL